MWGRPSRRLATIVYGGAVIVRDEAAALEAGALSRKVDEVHLAVLNLAATCGIFHGMNDAIGEEGIASRKQYDLIHVLVRAVFCLHFAKFRDTDTRLESMSAAQQTEWLASRAQIESG